jgi:hypothetical protein
VKRTTVLALVLVAAGSLAAAAFAFTSSGSRSALGQLSIAGTPVDPATLPAGERQTLEQAGIAPSVSFVREAAGIRFYTAKGPNGPCLITGRALTSRPHFGILVCPSGFPSSELPILDYSPRQAALTDSYPHLQLLAGFAADGIAGVGVQDEQGEVQWTEVVRNTYASRAVPAGSTTAIMARTASGEIVYTQTLGGRSAESEYSR